MLAQEAVSISKVLDKMSLQELFSSDTVQSLLKLSRKHTMQFTLETQIWISLKYQAIVLKQLPYWNISITP